MVTSGMASATGCMLEGNTARKGSAVAVVESQLLLSDSRIASSHGFPWSLADIGDTSTTVRWSDTAGALLLIDAQPGSVVERVIVTRATTGPAALLGSPAELHDYCAQAAAVGGIAGGGAIALIQSQSGGEPVLVRSCLLEDTAACLGGAIGVNQFGAVVVHRVVVQRSRAQYGGCLATIGAAGPYNVALQDSLCSAVWASIAGGALSAVRVSGLQVTNVAMLNTTSAYRGGAAHIVASVGVVMHRLRIERALSVAGAAVMVEFGEVVLSQLEVLDATAGIGGAVYVTDGAFVNITDSSVDTSIAYSETNVQDAQTGEGSLRSGGTVANHTPHPPRHSS